MKFIKYLVIFLILSSILNGCSSFSDAGKVLRNEKTKSTDEYLIKTKNPLIQPPDFETMIEPGVVKNQKKGDENKIKKLLKNPQTQPSKSGSKTTSTENSIINQIKK
jgi:PBP1b-binding outer membrane lipoprotein LpoB